MSAPAVDYFKAQAVADEYGLDYNKFCAAYRAMLAAAPEPPADARDAEIARLRDLLETICFRWDTKNTDKLEMAVEEARAALAPPEVKP